MAKPFSYGVEDELALAGDRVAVRRPGPKDYALVDLANGDIAATVDRYDRTRASRKASASTGTAPA